MLKNKSGSVNFRRTTDVLINQTVFQPSVKLLQIQGPIYKQLGFKTTPTGQGQSAALGNSGDDLALPLPTAGIRPPGHSRRAVCVTCWLSDISLLTPHRSSYQHGRKGEYRTQCTGIRVKTPPTVTSLPEAAASKRTGHRSLPPSTLLLWALIKLVSSTASTNFRFRRSCGTSVKSQPPERLRPRDGECKAQIMSPK